MMGLIEGPCSLRLPLRVPEPLDLYCSFSFLSVLLLSIFAPQSFHRFFRQHVFVSLSKQLANPHSPFLSIALDNYVESG